MVRLLVMLTAVGALSQFYRSCLGVIAPSLIHDLAITPATLGAANSAFYAALLVMQVPVGLAFDRFGPRRTVACLAGITALGSLALAGADGGRGLILALFVIGIGCSATFMAAVVLCVRWFPSDRLAGAMSIAFALSPIGNVLASTPLAAADAVVGWRVAFATMAAAPAVLAVLFYWLVRDQPPGGPKPPEPEPLPEVLSGLVRVWHTPNLGRILAMHVFAYASMATVLGLWAGPYLADVQGFGPVARGNVLLAMTLAQAAGILVFGRLDRVFNTRKWVVIPGVLGSIAVLSALAILPNPPTALAVGLLIAMCGVTAYPVLIVAQANSLFPPALAGRGATTVNLAQVAGTALLPLATAGIVSLVAGHATVVPALGYRLAFAAIGLALAGGLSFYLRAIDVRPLPVAERSGPAPVT